MSKKNYYRLIYLALFLASYIATIEIMDKRFTEIDVMIAAIVLILFYISGVDR